MKRILFFLLFNLPVISLMAGPNVDYVDSDELNTIAYSLDGKYIAVANLRGTIKIYDSVTLDIINTIPLNQPYGWTSQIAFSPDGIHIASCAGDNLLIHEFNTGKIVHRLPKATSISYNFDGTRLVSGSGKITIWDTMNGNEIMSMQGPRFINTISYSPDGNRILSNSEGYIIIWDANNGTQLRTIAEQGIHTVSASYSQDGTRIIVGYSDRDDYGAQAIRIYDSENYDVLFSRIIGRGEIKNAFFTQSNNYIVIAYYYTDYNLYKGISQIIIMNSANGNIMDTIPHGNYFVNARFPVAIDYSNNNIAYVANGKDIRTYKINL